MMLIIINNFIKVSKNDAIKMYTKQRCSKTEKLTDSAVNLET